MQSIVIDAIDVFFTVVYGMIFVRVLLSWFPMVHGTRIVRLLFSLTEPILSPIREIIRRSPLGGPGMVLDFSPIIAFFLITVVQNILVSLVRQIL